MPPAERLTPAEYRLLDAWRVARDCLDLADCGRRLSLPGVERRGELLRKSVDLLNGAMDDLLAERTTEGSDDTTTPR